MLLVDMLSMYIKPIMLYLLLLMLHKNDEYVPSNGILIFCNTMNSEHGPDGPPNTQHLTQQIIQDSEIQNVQLTLFRASGL